MDENEQAIKLIASTLGIKQQYVDGDDLVGAIISEAAYLKQAYAKSLDELFNLKQYAASLQLQIKKGGDTQ